MWECGKVGVRNRIMTYGLEYQVLAKFAKKIRQERRVVNLRIWKCGNVRM